MKKRGEKKGKGEERNTNEGYHIYYRGTDHFFAALISVRLSFCKGRALGSDEGKAMGRRPFLVYSRENKFGGLHCGE